MREAILFEEKQAVQQISLQELKQTQCLAEHTSKLPASKPVEHWQLIERTMELCDKHNLHPTLEPIWVSKSDSKKINLLDPDRIGKLESWLFQRLVTRIHLNSSLSNEDNNTAIGIGYNLHGLQVAFGTNVRVCSNMSIFGKQVVATYSIKGKDKTPFEQFFNILEGWMQKAGEIRDRDLGIFQLMKQYPVNTDVMDTLIGRLKKKAVSQAYIDSTEDAPLNIGQTSIFTRDYLKLETAQNCNNLYDAYNIATNILKPTTTDIVDMWSNVQSMGNFIAKDYLNLN